jgi:hypothetical protein
MKPLSVLPMAVLCLALSQVAYAGPTTGNPDQRASVTLGFGYGFGATKTYQATAAMDDRFIGEEDYRHQLYTGVLTLPASRDASFLFSFQWAEAPKPRTVQLDEFYSTDRLKTFSAAVKLYLP